LRIFWARLRRRIFFLRHFHRCLPRFFQARELRFIIPELLVLADILSALKYLSLGKSEWRARRDIRPLNEGFEPGTSG